MQARDWIGPGVIVAIMTVWLALSAGRFAAIDDQYKDISTKIYELEVKLDRSINRFAATDDRHADISKRISELDAKLDRSVSAISAADKQHADIAKIVAELEAKLRQSLGAVSAADNHLADLAKRVGELDAKLDRDSNSSSARLEQVVQQQTALAGQIGEIRSELNILRGLTENVRDKIEAAPVQPAPQPPTTSGGDQ
jgi:chromosome segregation ATPase